VHLKEAKRNPLNDVRDLPTGQGGTTTGGVETAYGVAPLYRRLRSMILDGKFPPGSMLSQVKLAESLGVSRIPLREALRMLQKDGLVEAEHNQRARVPAFDSSIVDSLYASRILLEALSIRLSVPYLDQVDRATLQQLLSELDAVAAHLENLNDWEIPHRRFHALLVSHVEESLRERIASYSDQCEYYRRLYYRLVSTHHPTRSAEVIAAEHRAIASACLEGKADLAAYLLARHYARTVLTVLGQMAPEFDPVAVRTALQIIGGTASHDESSLLSRQIPPERQSATQHKKKKSVIPVRRN
jgi:DNA-binding GntR family transcriptional regulator